MKKLNKVIFAAFLSLAVLAPVASTMAQDPPQTIKDKDLLDHLEAIGTWQRNIIAIETAPDNSLESLLKDTLQQNAAKVLQYGFDFARAEAITLTAQQANTATVEDPSTSHAQIMKASADITTRITEIGQEQAKLDSQLKRTRNTRLRNTILIQREKLDSELKIAHARQDLLQSVITLYTEKDKKTSSTITDKINNLALTLPVTTDKTKKDAAKTTTQSSLTSILPVTVTTTATNNAPDQPKSRGIITISSDVFNEYRKKKELEGLLIETDNLAENNQRLITLLRGTLQDAVKRGNEMTQALSSADKATIDAQRTKIDEFVSSFKQLSTAVVPLAQINTWLDASRHDLKEWRSSLDDQMSRLLRSLFLQLTLLGFAILIPIGISEATRRTIVKYIHDSKRQHQLNIARRAVLGFVIFIIILLNFVTEFDSLATFAGFLTAGVAVALQNVILSLVAHFFYFGRFGVRVGDRITIKDVTGEVVQVGMVRLYLMELGGPGPELYPTGRIAAYPNSVLFEKDPFMKQITGADYTWQEITFMLDPSSDYQLANKKLSEAVNIVYAQYHDVMESQKQAMTRTTHLDVNMPVPKGFLNFIDSGLAFIIRYPIQSDHVVEINQRITKALLEAIGKEPSLKLLSSNPPKIVAVDHA